MIKWLHKWMLVTFLGVMFAFFIIGTWSYFAIPDINKAQSLDSLFIFFLAYCFIMGYLLFPCWVSSVTATIALLTFTNDMTENGFNVAVSNLKGSNMTFLAILLVVMFLFSIIGILCIRKLPMMYRIFVYLLILVSIYLDYQSQQYYLFVKDALYLLGAIILDISCIVERRKL